MFQGYLGLEPPCERPGQWTAQLLSHSPLGDHPASVDRSLGDWAHPILSINMQMLQYWKHEKVIITVGQMEAKIQ